GQDACLERAERLVERFDRFGQTLAELSEVPAHCGETLVEQLPLLADLAGALGHGLLAPPGRGSEQEGDQRCRACQDHLLLRPELEQAAVPLDRIPVEAL